MILSTAEREICSLLRTGGIFARPQVIGADRPDRRAAVESKEVSMIANKIALVHLKARVASAVAAAVVLVGCSGQHTAGGSSGRWESDFGAFASAIKTSIRNGENLEAQFRPQTSIEWNVTFGKLEGNVINFLEADPLEKASPSVSVWLTIRETEKGKAGLLKSGEKIVARCKSPFVVAMQSPSHPSGEILFSPNDCTLR